MNRERLSICLSFTAIAAVILGDPTSLFGQISNAGRNNRANRDPVQTQVQRLERYRERLEIKGDEDWMAIQPKIEQVLQAQRELRTVEARRVRRGNQNLRQRNNNTNNDRTRSNRRNSDTQGAEYPNPDGNSNGESSPDLLALKAALDSKASRAEVQTRLAKLREIQKQKKASLAKAQAELRRILTLRQEAIASLTGLL